MNISNTCGIFQARCPISEWSPLAGENATGYANVPQLWPTLNPIQPDIKKTKQLGLEMELESQNIQETKLKAKCESVCACELMLHPVQPPRRLDSNGRSNVETMTTA